MAVSVKIDDGLKERIHMLADARQRSAHWIMRQAIEEYVEREEKRAQFHQDAVNAWQQYQADGLHLTQAEAEQWLVKLEAGEDAEIPECHQ
ncbi:Predicted transcriptional regulator [Acinetobacter marinus]|uniref:Predicted transcriptional regulator n=1 Tax=Acinetobacter marinus TaxID=281375 RepID=A0A1G6ISB3_9GAMM|nr:ribbon-helix-helix protein, CopG family [Acinetobacter marinus]SDC09462.1 Predicted transcriptional regulator [Acinetobacter marinus]